MSGVGSHTRDFAQRLREISKFFAGSDDVHKTLRRLVRRLTQEDIPYAIAGGLAVNAHNYRRTTADVDILLTPKSFAKFTELFVPKHYRKVAQRSRRFVERKTDVQVDILVTGLYPGSGKPGPVAFPDPKDVAETIGGLRVLDLPTLVQLKLAARRHRDFGDVVELIRFNELDESFAEQLHKSVRRDFRDCLDEKRREDEYDARNA